MAMLDPLISPEVCRLVFNVEGVHGLVPNPPPVLLAFQPIICAKLAVGESKKSTKRKNEPKSFLCKVESISL
ncbi:hypothetical protein D9M68_466960 [compost metagenome]